MAKALTTKQKKAAAAKAKKNKAARAKLLREKKALAAKRAKEEMAAFKKESKVKDSDLSKLNPSEKKLYLNMKSKKDPVGKKRFEAIHGLFKKAGKI